MNINNTFHSSNQNYQLSDIVVQSIKDRLRLLITSVTYESFNLMANDHCAVVGLTERRIDDQSYRIMATKEKDNSGDFKDAYLIENITNNKKYFLSPSIKIEKSEYNELEKSTKMFLNDRSKAILEVLNIQTSSPPSQSKYNNH